MSDQSPAAEPTPPPDDREVAGALRLDLESARFTVEGLAAAWGPVAGAALGRSDRVPALIALAARRPDAVGTLARLFVLGNPVSEADADAALPHLGLQRAIGDRLLARRRGLVVPLVDVRPVAIADETGVAAWWIVSDLGEGAVGGELPTWHVLGAGTASATLTGILVPLTGRVLDLGTGSGVQALHASRTADAVVATDVSARAVAFARFTAALNGVSLDLRTGSLYAPLGGERFDRIISNPPFVITPRGRSGVPDYSYRDGGREGDELVAEIVRGAAGHLAPGGVLQLLVNWEVHGDEGTARERVLDWGSLAGLDVWVVQRDLLDPAEYAETWIRDGGVPAGSPRSGALIAAWLTDFADRGVTAVGVGHLTARKPAGSAVLRRFEVLPERPGGGVGAAIAAGLAAVDALAGVDDARLATWTVRVAPDVTEHRHHWPGEEHPTVLELVQGGGLARRRRVDTATAAVVGASDGELPLGRIADAVARLLDADSDALTTAVLRDVRELLVEGFLLLP